MDERAGGRARRVALLLGMVGLLVIVVIGVEAQRRSDQQAGGSTGSAGGFESPGQTIDTSPFELARSSEESASTTIPGGDPFEPGATTTPPPAPTTTIPIPEVAADDPECAMTRTVIEALRILTGPAGASPENLESAAGRYREAADLARRSGRPGIEPVAVLLLQMAADLPGARVQADVEAIYNRLNAPTDPEIIAAAREYQAHVSQFCPDLLSIEP